MIKKEVKFEIAGGLGNQLFMLSAGVYFKEKFNQSVVFEISNLDNVSILHPGHNVQSLGLLNGFKVLKCKKCFTGWPWINGWINRIKSRLTRRKTFIVPEVGFFDFSEIPKNCSSIRGYFQSWRYFEAITDKPRLNLESVSNPTEWYLKEIVEIKQNEFAAFHLRRGDYKLTINRKQGILSKSYFERIANLVPEDVELIFFTDSPDEIKVEFASFTKKFRIMEPPRNSDPIESLLMMSQASYIAISNSTYSWWAAALAKPNTHVYAPSKWFELAEDPIDLYPENWTKIQSEWEYQN